MLVGLEYGSRPAATRRTQDPNTGIWNGYNCKEIIKHGRYFLLPSLERIFTDIIETGNFLTEWNIGVIKPIDKKKGDKNSLANYRNCSQQYVLNQDQFGLRPNARTTDSIFILCQLIHKYTQQHKNLYVGFIDSSLQCGMIHKLHEYGI